MADRIRMNFDLMDELVYYIQLMKIRLEMGLEEVNAIASILEDGGLLGGAGEAFSAGCRGPLAGSISRLNDKFDELEKDIKAAIFEMMAADTEAKSRY